MAPPICPVCGHVLSPDLLVCPECGSDDDTGWSTEAWKGPPVEADPVAAEFVYDEFIKEEFDETDHAEDMVSSTDRENEDKPPIILKTFIVIISSAFLYLLIEHHNYFLTKSSFTPLLLSPLGILSFALFFVGLLSKKKKTIAKQIEFFTVLSIGIFLIQFARQEFGSNSKYVSSWGIKAIGADKMPIRITDNPKAKDPAFNELIDFIRNDKTDKNSYVLDKYVCAEFAKDVHDNAESAGIRCGYVLVDFGNSMKYRSGIGHALNVFNTTDKGLVFIDCTAPENGSIISSDWIVGVKKGRSIVYNSRVNGNSIDPVFIEGDFIKDVDIIW